jgi:protease IV
VVLAEGTETQWCGSAGARLSAAGVPTLARMAALREILPDRSQPLLLELDLTEPLVEVAPPDPVGRVLTRRRGSLREVLDGLRRAANDSAVRAVIAKIGGWHMTLARAQELRDAIAQFRGRGKRTVAWAETFGEFGAETIPYYLASGFDQIWLQPSGNLGLTGVSTEVVFLRNALRKAGVTPQFGQRHEYKSAANLFTEQGFTPAHRENIERLVASMMEQVVNGVATARQLRPEDVRAAIDRAPLTAAEALDAGLVDRLGYRDEVYAAVRGEVGEQSQLRFVARYAKASPAKRAARSVVRRARPSVALVYGLGAVLPGRSRRGVFGQVMGSSTVSAAIRAAVEDDDVKAIVFRVDSSGGSYVASDAIWRETVLARRAGKPLVVSMGALAASGGYFVSMAADAIVAQPGTLTGSIGVVAGKPVFVDLLDRLGIGYDAVVEGEHARMYSTRAPFSERDWELVNRWLDHVYADFTAKVAECRGLSRGQVDAVARGRIWTGADAQRNGLVDELGGLDAALDLARRRAGLPPDAPVHVFPKVSPIDRVRPPASSQDKAAAAGAVWTGDWGPLASVARSIGLTAGGPLTLPGYPLRG